MVIKKKIITYKMEGEDWILRRIYTDCTASEVGMSTRIILRQTDKTKIRRPSCH